VEQGNRHNDEIFSKRVRAGKRRTYFFDIRTTKSNDYYITITESKRRFDDDGYERHKLHLYKEDINKFLEAFEETANYLKTELIPDYDFDEFSHKYDEEYVPPSKQKEVTVEASTEEPAAVEEPVSEETIPDDPFEEDDSSADESWDLD